MCGIAGYVGLTRDGAGEPLLRRMARQLAHRGPDGEGILVHGDVGLVHRRLAIIDPEGRQPMRSADGRYVIVYDGMVYNCHQLRAELVGLGHKFDTTADAEVILAAWAQWGAGAFDRCDGMFALAILDTYSGELVLVRDQFGIKPLYLSADGSGRVAFGSEIRAVLAAAVVPRRPDPTSVYRYLCFGVQDDGPATFFDRVDRLLPGELAIVSPDGRVRQRRYTRLYRELEWLAATPRPYDADAGEQVKAELAETVRRRLRSDLPVGTALAPGLASAMVAAQVDRLLIGHDPATTAIGPIQRAFAALPASPSAPARQYLAAVEARCADRLALHQVHPGPERFTGDLVDFVRTQQEPVTSPTAYAHYCLMREASTQVRVVLSGLGASEMFGGYPPYFLVNLRQLHRVRGPLPAVAELVRSADLLWQLGRGQAAEVLHRLPAIAPTVLLSQDFAAAQAGHRVGVVVDDLKRRVSADMFRYRLPARLRYADRNCARFGLEGRPVLLDQKLLRLLWSLESAALIKNGWTQRALRDAGRAGLLPRSVVRRRGDCPGWSQAEWLDRSRDVVREVFRSESFAQRPYLNAPAVVSAFESYIDGKRVAPPRLFWRLLNLELWLRESVDRDPLLPPANTLVDYYRVQPVKAAQRTDPMATQAVPPTATPETESAPEQLGTHQPQDLVDLTDPQQLGQAEVGAADDQPASHELDESGHLGGLIAAGQQAGQRHGHQ